MQIANSNIVVTLPDQDWQREVDRVRLCLGRATPEQRARGHVLGEAMHMLRARESLRRMRDWNGPPDEDVRRLAIDLLEIDTLDPEDGRAFHRARHGLSIPHHMIVRAPTRHFSHYLAEARRRLHAMRDVDKRLLRERGRIPSGWKIDITGLLPAEYGRESHISEAWQ